MHPAVKKTIRQNPWLTTEQRRRVYKWTGTFDTVGQWEKPTPEEIESGLNQHLLYEPMALWLDNVVDAVQHSPITSETGVPKAEVSEADGSYEN